MIRFTDGTELHLNEVLSIRAQEFPANGISRRCSRSHLNEVLSIRAQEFANC